MARKALSLPHPVGSRPSIFHLQYQSPSLKLIHNLKTPQILKPTLLIQSLTHRTSNDHRRNALSLRNPNSPVQHPAANPHPLVIRVNDEEFEEE